MDQQAASFFATAAPRQAQAPARIVPAFAWGKTAAGIRFIKVGVGAHELTVYPQASAFLIRGQPLQDISEADRRLVGLIPEILPSGSRALPQHRLDRAHIDDCLKALQRGDREPTALVHDALVLAHAGVPDMRPSASAPQSVTAAATPAPPPRTPIPTAASTRSTNAAEWSWTVTPRVDLAGAPDWFPVEDDVLAPRQTPCSPSSAEPAIDRAIMSIHPDRSQAVAAIMAHVTRTHQARSWPLVLDDGCVRANGRPLVLIDTETGGGNHDSSALLSVSVRVAGNPDLSRIFYALPGTRDVRPEAIAKNGLTPERLQQLGAGSERDLMDGVKHFLTTITQITGAERLTAVAQNASFDRRFVAAAAGRTWTALPLEPEWLCTLRTSRAFRSCSQDSTFKDGANTLDDLFLLATGSASPRGATHDAGQDTALLHAVVMAYQRAGIPLAEA